jgi:predicted amidohydrolase YtcJ
MNVLHKQADLSLPELEEPGKLADIALLDRDYFSVPEADIPKVRAVFTLVGGRVVQGAL